MSDMSKKEEEGAPGNNQVDTSLQHFGSSLQCTTPLSTPNIFIQGLLPLFDVESLNCFVLTGHKLGAVTKTGCALKLSMDQFNNHFNSKKAAMEDFEILERKIASDIYKRIWSISSKTQFEVLFSSKHQQIRLKFWNSCSLINCVKAIC